MHCSMYKPLICCRHKQLQRRITVVYSSPVIWQASMLTQARFRLHRDLDYDPGQLQNKSDMSAHTCVSPVMSDALLTHRCELPTSALQG